MMGTGSAVARIGAMIANSLFSSQAISNANIFLIFMAANLIMAGMVTVSLPETAGQPLPETVKDLADLDKTCYFRRSEAGKKRVNFTKLIW